MLSHRFVANFASVLAALACTAILHAGVNRTFVSTAGSDANSSSSCGPTTPCRTFAVALSATNSGGEVVVLASGGYGAFSITAPVTITAIGVDASITATSGSAITISTTGNVTITGLGLHGGGTGTTGVAVTQVGFLRLYDIIAEGFATSGVSFPSGSLAIYDSHLNDDVTGLAVSGGNVYVHTTGFDHNTMEGLAQTAGSVVIADSSAYYNGTGFATAGGTLSLVRDQAVLNGVGIGAANGGTILQLSYCIIAQNTTFSYLITTGGAISGSNPATSIIAGSGSGTLSAATALQ